MTDAPTKENQSCPHCNGTGQIPQRTAEQFPIGSRVHYDCSWWKYPKGADGVVLAHSASGQRVRIKYQENDHKAEPIIGRFEYSYVTPAKLELLP